MLVAIGAIIGGTNSFNFLIIGAAAASGAALGDWFSYWLGYHYHERIQSMWPLKNHPTLIEKGRVFFKKWGAWAIVLARFSGPLRASVPIAAGIAQMPQAMFQLANWSSAFLWAFVLLSPGAVGINGGSTISPEEGSLLLPSIFQQDHGHRRSHKAIAPSSTPLQLIAAGQPLSLVFRLV